MGMSVPTKPEEFVKIVRQCDGLYAVKLFQSPGKHWHTHAQYRLEEDAKFIAGRIRDTICAAVEMSEVSDEP